MKNNPKISIIGAGYVGYSLALLYAEKNKVLINEIDNEKLEKLKKGIPLIKGKGIKKYLSLAKYNLSFSSDLSKTAKKSDLAFIALPTNFNEKKNRFDTSLIESVVKKLIESNPNIIIIIKSTIPIGFTEKLIKKHKNKNIMFSPEFLREGKSIRDNLYPDRVILGSVADQIVRKKILGIFRGIVLKKNLSVIEMNPSDAEAVKLLSNTYLAMRVAFFNELDSLSLNNNLDSKSIICGISLDKRIGDFYNNPSFGFGGYCLPKDTKQMGSHFINTNNRQIIESINHSNNSRINFIVESIIDLKPKIVGVYGVEMKAGSDNLRESTSLKVAEGLKQRSIKTIIFDDKELLINSNFEVTNDLSLFDSVCDIIILNRIDKISKSFKTKTFSRDIFNRD
tara:strand:+ start:13428 stop:14612 length:1185 start_codon:yes stop_codon:yes gene_type:complete